MSAHSLPSTSSQGIPLRDFSPDEGNTTPELNHGEHNNASDQGSPSDTGAGDAHVHQIFDNSSPPAGAASAKPTWAYPHQNKWRIMAACLQGFGNGANDSAPGAIIASAEAYYHVEYSVISMIFVALAVGFLTAAFCVDALDRRLQRSRTLALSEVFCIIGYVMMVVTPPFPVYVLGYFFCGFGQAVMLALNNVYCANFADGTVILGFLHGLYGIGGAIAPIIATKIISTGNIFTRFYIFMICLRTTSLVFASWAFWRMENDAESFQRSHNAAETNTTGLEGGIQSSTIQDNNNNTTFHAPSKRQILKRSLKEKATPIGALFVFLYQGVEVASAGWITSFLIDVRHGNPSSTGYVPSGFWAGIAIGRLILSYVASRYTAEVPFTYAVILAALGMQIVCWLVPSVIGSATAVSLIGLFIGPIYPCTTTLLSHLLERSVQETAIAFITSSGSAGGAVLPLITGVLSQAKGIWVLQPICVALYVMMEFCWAGLSWGKLRKKSAE